MERRRASPIGRRPAFLYPELHLVGPHDVLVELHWDWTGERLPERDPADDPEAYLVYLCRHAGKHFWSSLRWSADIELYLRKFGGGLDWDSFWRLAREAGAERSCAASFQLCSRLFDRPLRPAERRGPTRAGRKLSERAELSLKRAEPVGLRSHPVVRLLDVDSPKQRALRCLSLMAPAPRHWTLPSGGRRSWAGVWLERYRRLALEAAAALCPFAVWTRRLRKAALLSAGDWFLLARAWVLLAGVKPAIRFLPFSRLEPWATRVRTKAAVADDAADGRETAATIRRTVLLVDAAARRHFVAMECLPRSLVTARLLGQKGIRADLKIGVREEKGRIAGHAWVEYENEAINDGGGYRTYSALPRQATRGEGGTVRLQIPENVVFQVLDGQAVVLNLDSGYYFGLNEVGTRFWQRLGKTASLDAIMEELLGEFEVERAVLEQDIAELIKDLKTRKLVEEAPSEA